MKLQIIITLEPDGEPCQMTQFETTTKRGIGHRDRTTNDEAIRAAEAFIALTADAKCWIAGRMKDAPEVSQ